jgi:hypothetical protein
LTLLARVKILFDAVDAQALANLERRRHGHEREDGQKPRIAQHFGVWYVETEEAGTCANTVKGGVWQCR